MAKKDKNTIRIDEDTIASGMSSKDTVKFDSKTIKAGLSKQTEKVNDSKIISSGLSPALQVIPQNPVEYEFNGKSYKLISKISDSSTEAEIYLISRNDTNYAFKFYYPFVKPKPEIVEKLKNLNHPDILSILDYGYFNNRFFEILPYADKGSLNDQLPIKNIPKLKRIISQIVTALDFIHSNGIIHRDIKPSNIFVNSEQNKDVIIGDFGIASIVDDGEVLRRTSIFQTPIYAAPEYKVALRGETIITKAVDYYALGITIWELFIGTLPPANMDDLEFLRLMFEGTPPLPQSMDKDIAHLIRGLTTRDYKKRWGSQEIKKWLNGEKVEIYLDKDELENKEVLEFREDNKGNKVYVSTAKELAKLINDFPDEGRKLLYRGFILDWLKKTKQRKLYLEVADAIEYKFKNNEEAGTQFSIYLLDSSFPYISTENKELRTKSEIIEELETHFDLYKTRLQNEYDRLYLYLLSKKAEKDVETFQEFFKHDDNETALYKVIFSLKSQISQKVTFTLQLGKKEINVDNLRDLSIKILNHPKLADSILGNKRFLIWLDLTNNSLYNDYIKRVAHLPREEASKLVPYLLSPDLGYIGLDGDECQSLVEIGKEMAEHFEEYLKILKNKSSQIYHYLKYKEMTGEVEYFHEVFDLESSSVKPGIYNEYIALFKVIKGCGYYYNFQLKNRTIGHPNELLSMNSDDLKIFKKELNNSASLFFAWVSVFFHEHPLNEEENFYIYYLEDYEERLRQFIIFLEEVDSSNRFVKRFKKANELSSEYRSGYSKLKKKLKREITLAYALPIIFAEILLGYTLVFPNIDLPSNVFSLGSWYFLIFVIGFTAYYFFAFSNDSDFTISTGCIGAPIIGSVLGIIGYYIFYFILFTPILLLLVLSVAYYFIYLQIRETTPEIMDLADQVNTTSNISEVEKLSFLYTFDRIDNFEVTKSNELQSIESELSISRFSIWIFGGIYCIIILAIIILLIFNTPNLF